MPSNPFMLTTPREMLDKAKYQLDRLNGEPSAYAVFDFFVAAYHVHDYVRQHSAVAAMAIDALLADPDLDQCGFICNRGKHLVLRNAKYAGRSLTTSSSQF